MSRVGIASGFNADGSITPDNLLSGEFPRLSRIVTVMGQATLIAGTVLGKITADGRYRISETASRDGSEQPDAILAEAIDLSHGDVQASVYLTGEFNSNALTLGNGHTLASVTSACRMRSIFFRSNQS